MCWLSFTKLQWIVIRCLIMKIVPLDWQMSWSMVKPTKSPVRPAKTDQPGHLPSLISLHCPHEEALGPWLSCEDWVLGYPLKTGQMPRLIWDFARRTGHFVGFVMLWLNLWFVPAMEISTQYLNYPKGIISISFMWTVSGYITLLRWV